jgi:hypothetical protein
MKSSYIIAGAALALILGGCSTLVAVAPVGPNPAALSNHAKLGQLQVFSALVGRTEGDNPTWFQHGNYTILDSHGNMVTHVANRVGKYALSPQLVSLRPGKYIIKAEARDYFRVRIPVVIEAGRTTRVHLDDTWKPMDAKATELVSLPSGTPVGWSTGDH